MLFCKQIVFNNSMEILQLRDIILNVRKPTILKNFHHKWTCFESGLQEWCEIFDKYSDEKPFWECMQLDETSEPQWERKRKLEQMSAKEFLEKYSEGQCNYWSGLNYKRKHEIPKQSTNGIDFGCFGFPEMTDDCTLWLSSKGANTPCHYDTYGCNVVVQVFGRKSWLLLPPDAKILTTTRIPYEESSVYCLENFYAPSCKQISKLDKINGDFYHCILEPNDVLIVPKHWWHFVEALEISLSVNAWIPLSSDVDDQIDECIVKHFIDKFLMNTNQPLKEYVLNPNQLFAITTDDELLKVLEYLVEQKTRTDSLAGDNKKTRSVYQYQYLSEIEVEAIKSSIKNITEVHSMTKSELSIYLKTNHSRYCTLENKSGDDRALCQIEEALFNSICSPQIIKIIKDEFLRRCNGDT